MPSFRLDSIEDVAWTCESFDEPWNGWASPVVDWETLVDVAEEIGWWVRSEGSIFRLAPDRDAPDDEIVVIKPDDAGQFHLRELGWTFVEGDSEPAEVIPFRSKADR